MNTSSAHPPTPRTYTPHTVYTHTYVHCSPQCVMDPDTGEPQDELLPQAKQAVADLGSQCTKVSEIVEQKDKAVFTAIQDGLDRANEHAVSRAQRVSTKVGVSHPGGSQLGQRLSYILRPSMLTI